MRRPKLLASLAMLLAVAVGLLLYHAGLLPPGRTAVEPTELRNHSVEPAPHGAAQLAVEAPDQGGPPAARPPQTRNTQPTTRASVRSAIYFYPNDANPLKRVARQRKGRIVEELYDPNAPAVLRRIAQQIALAKQVHIAIVGHADASTSGQTPDAAARALARHRARAIEIALQRQLETLPALPNITFSLEAGGRPHPAGSEIPQQHWQNRRADLQLTVRRR